MALRRPSRPRLLGGVLAALVLLLAGIWLGGHPNDLPGPLRGAFFEDRSNRLVDQVLSLLQSQYYRRLNRSTLVDQSISGMVASLHDPYSHYYSPSNYGTFQQATDPHLSGIGVDVALDPRGLRVLDVFAGSPAAAAGVKARDIIIAVGHTSLAHRPASFGSGLIKGKAGTSVSLTLLRNGHRKVVRAVRADIVVPVTEERNLTYRGIHIGYLELARFTQGCGQELRGQLQKALKAHAQALVLDLRDNGGGLLEEAVNVASLFIPDGTIVSTDGRSQPRQLYVAKGHALAPHIPMVVLVNHNTASAAEIVTGALQDRGRAKIVGTRTYGKGVFQEVEPLSNGGALDITVGEYFTPSGRNLGGGGVRQGAGIKPNVYAAANPHASTDTAIAVAEKTVSAEVR
jgi:carboxyl-terminal processing protease